MTADVELLPLYAELQGHPKLEIIKHYARSNVAHATAPLQAEIEALRAQLDEQCRLHAIGMERELALITERDRLRMELDRLQQQYDERTACMIVHRGAALACSDAVRAAYCDEHERAERLAEALREIASQGPHYGPDGTYKTWRHWADIARDALEQEKVR